MPETLNIPKDASKQEIYESLISQIRALIEGEENLIANLANVSSALHTAFQNLWTGFYIMEGNMLVLGPFQGPIACTRIPVKPIARGVCGIAASMQKTQIIPDVNKFQGHIACSSASRSEIVVPLVDKSGITRLVLDIDSKNLNTFDEIDQKYCEEVIGLIQKQNF